jgi:hypothetical protein
MFVTLLQFVLAWGGLDVSHWINQSSFFHLGKRISSTLIAGNSGDGKNEKSN